MARSKVGALCDFLDGTERFKVDPMGIYHAARRVRDSVRMKDATERFRVVKRTLAPLAVMVSLETDGRIRIHRPDTGSNLYV